MYEMAKSEIFASGPNEEFSMLDEIVKTQCYSEFLLENLLKKSSIDEAALTEEEKWEKEQARLFPSMTDGQLKPYLIKGVKWLISLWQNGLNGILEDEMGYGAVIQTLGFLAHLKANGLHGPYMIVSSQHVEGAGIPDWLSGIRLFPNMKHLLYFGDKQSRTKMRKEFEHKTVGPDFPIILTTYFMVMSDKEWLAHYNWKYVVVDQSHQMKKREYELSDEVKHLPWDNKLLLVRSHSMENLAELRSLLKFALPHVLLCHKEFDSWFDFSDKEGEQHRIEEKRRAHQLHSILRPFLVRQVGEDVENRVPQKKSATGYQTEVVHQSNAIGVACSKNHTTKEVKRASAESSQAVASKVSQKKGATCSDAISVTSSKDHAVIEGTRTGAESCQEVAAEVVSKTGGEGSPDMRPSQLCLCLEGNKVVKRRRTDDVLMTPLGESDPAARVQVPKSISSEVIFNALEEIPDLDRVDTLRAYSTLIRDDRQFESLMALPMDMRKDWLLMEIGNKVCSIVPAP